MSEMFDAINAQASQASEREREEAERNEKMLTEWRAQQERRRIRQRKRATRSLILRALFVVAAVVLLCIAQVAGLIDFRLAVALSGIVSGWLCVWAGAWLQFMFADGGLLSVTK